MTLEFLLPLLLLPKLFGNSIPLPILIILHDNHEDLSFIYSFFSSSRRVDLK